MYHTEEGTRHKFFRVYPYIKQLRRWIKNKRREQASGRHPAAGARPDSTLGSAGIHGQHHHHHQQQHRQHELHQQHHQQTQSSQASAIHDATQPTASDTEASVIAKPAPVTHCSAPEQPGQTWLNFTLDRERVLQHLALLLPPMSQTVV